VFIVTREDAGHGHLLRALLAHIGVVDDPAREVERGLISVDCAE
jgi:hypothetical protein